MQIRFKCPECGGQHVTSIPDSATVHMACGNATIRIRLTKGLDVKSDIIRRSEVIDQDKSTPPPAAPPLWGLYEVLRFMVGRPYKKPTKRRRR